MRLARDDIPESLALAVHSKLDLAGAAIAVAVVSATLVILPLYEGGRNEPVLHLFAAIELLTLAVLAAARVARLPLDRSSRQVLGVMAVILVAATSATVASESISTSVGEWLVRLCLLVTMLLVFQVVRVRPLREALVAALLAAVIIQVAWSWFVWVAGGGGDRAHIGTFYGPNQFAGYVLLLAPLLLAPALLERARVKALLWGALATMSYLALLLSGSRGGVACAAIAIVPLSIAVVRVRSRAETAVRLVLVLVAILALGQALVGGATRAVAEKNEVRAESSGTEAGNQVRLQWAEGAMRIGSRHPLVGTGLGTYGAVLPSVAEPSWAWSKWAHNEYLEAFAEGGLPLAIGVIAFPIVVLVAGWRRVKHASTSDHFWRVGLWAGVLGAALHALIDHDWSDPGYAMTLVAVSALVVCDTGPTSRRPRRWGTAAGLAVVGIAGAAVVLVETLSSSMLVPHGSIAEDAAVAKRASMLAPWSAEPHQWIAERALAAEPPDHELAVAHLRSALHRDGLSPSLWVTLAQVYELMHDEAKARAAYKAAGRVAPGLRLAILQASFERDAGNRELAITILQRSVRRYGAVSPPELRSRAAQLRDQLLSTARSGSS